MRLPLCFAVVFIFAASAPNLRSQELITSPPPLIKPNALMGTTASSDSATVAASSRDEHRFWDRKNDWLFAGVAAGRTLDYFSTLNFRRRGHQEVFLTNDIVDNHAGFAVIEAASTGASVGASYIFHHYRHHKLERWTSIVHIGLATSGAVRNYSLKTVH